MTELEFRLYPVDRLYAGMAMFDVDRAADVLAVYREWADDEPDESSTALVAMTVPPVPVFPEAVRGRGVLMLRALYVGSPEAAERNLAPLRQAAGEQLMDAFREMAYPETATLGAPPVPLASAMRIELFHDLSDDVVALGLGANGLVSGVEFRHWGGAPARPDGDAGPSHRDAPFSVVVAAMAEDGSQAPALRRRSTRLATSWRRTRRAARSATSSVTRRARRPPTRRRTTAGWRRSSASTTPTTCSPGTSTSAGGLGVVPERVVHPGLLGG